MRDSVTPAGGRRVRRGVQATVLVAALCGCQVDTTIAVDVTPGGTGEVVVTVALDQAADAAIGGLGPQLQISDLAAQGWTVSPVAPAPGGGETVTARHPFTTLAQVSTIVSSLAGAGAGTSRPFALTFSRHSSLWSTSTAVRGTVDLTCGVACFGDAGLAASTGSPVGVDPVALAQRAGVTPAEALRFGVRVSLPGTVTATDGARLAGGVMWHPQLGETLVLSATARTWHGGTIAAAAGIGAVALGGAAAAAIVVWRRRRRSRRASHEEDVATSP